MRTSYPDASYLLLIRAIVHRAALDARSRDPVLASEAELWLRSEHGAACLEAIGQAQGWTLRTLELEGSPPQQ